MSTHVFGVALGVPLPLSVYGFRRTGSSGGSSSSGSGTPVLVGGGVFYDHSFGATSGLHMGVSLDSAGVRTRVLNTPTWIYLVSGGPHLSLWSRLLPARSPTLMVRFAAGPSALVAGIIIDEYLRRDAVSFGGKASLSLVVVPRRWHRRWGIQLAAGGQSYAPPVRSEPWFNQSLGSSHLLGFTAGLSHHWPR